MTEKGWTPSNWASLSPFGIGHQRPNNYMEFVHALKANRHDLGYAWRILTEGVCDGCALGTTGMTDWTLKGVHLCNIRLRLLELNTLPAMDATVLADVEQLKKMNGDALRKLGRIPHPMIRRKGEKGFTRLSWNEALTLWAEKLKASDPNRFGVYMTSRGIPNETYYSVQKAVRAIGTNNIDNAARVCHSPSTVALKAGIGAGATTCSYTDWMKADVIVFIGSNVANNQPVATKYMHFAKKNGAKIVSINPYKEPGMERYWIPSLPESALFGTKLADRFYQIQIGSDVAFLNGVLKYMIDNELCDSKFIKEHTEGFAETAKALGEQTWESLENASGATRNDMAELGQQLGHADRAVFVWSMGITQHQHGVDNVRSIINLALTKGFVGREGCGLMPIRGHSGVQGGAEMGAYATAFPGGKPINENNASVLSEQWGFSVPTEPGLNAPEMLDAAHRGELDVLCSIGGNFLEVMPDPDFVAEAMANIPMRVHQDIVLSSQMLLEPNETVLLLPAMTRYEIPGGVTETSTERRVIFSPEIEGPRIDEARPEGDVLLELARIVKPDLELAFESTKDVRAEIAEVIPFYDGIQDLHEKGDQFQYGGAHLCEDYQFGTPDGKGHFAPLVPAVQEIPDGAFRLTTRRGKQFNSIVQEAKDSLTGAVREAVLMNEEDAAFLNLQNNQPITLKNNLGEMTGRVCIAPVHKGSLQVHWPEGNVLLDPACRAPAAGVPDYNAWVKVEKGND
jgi:molybdopterin-dependent oxidoreductase alpha subunit